MNIHRKLGALFASFCALMLGWHLLTPDNPHHAVNVVLHLSMAAAFAVSTLLSVGLCRYFHPALFLVGVAATAWGGNFPVACVLSFMALFLHYAYGGYRTSSPLRVALSFIMLFLVLFLSVVLSGYGYGPAYGVALAWTLLAVAGFWFVWFVFQEFAADIIQQNRDVLELNKRLSKGVCPDATKRRGV